MKDFFKNKFEEGLYISVLLLSFIAFYVETDIYTPSFPDMVSYFETDEETIQMLLSMNFFGLCLSSLFFGPASDAYGRKAILCSGLGLFAFGSFGCAFTDSLNWMIFFRLLQGIGCGSIVSAGLASCFDVYPPDKSSRLVSVMNGTVGGMMALAPLIGNWVSLHYGWRMNFYIINVLATSSFVLTTFFIKETLAKEKRTKLSLHTVLKNYFSILCNLPFMAHTLIWCLAFSMVIVFISNLSLIFIDHLGVAREIFGYYQTTIMGAFFVGSMSAAYLIKKAGMLFTKVLGSGIYILGVLSLTFASLLGDSSPLFLVMSMASVSLGSGLALTIYFAYSMSHIDESLKGSAMSLTQSLRLFLSSSLVGMAANYFDGTTAPLTYLALTCTAVCVALYFLLYTRNQHLVPDAS